MILYIICLVLFGILGVISILLGFLNSEKVLVGTGGIMVLMLLFCILGLLFENGTIVFG